MKVLITGAAGLLGSDCWRVFSDQHEVWAIGRTRPRQTPAERWMECDIRDAAAVYTTVTRLNPDLIVHCASFNDVDAAEKTPDEAFRTNALGTRNLALACQRFDTVLASVSTDYVFDGSNSRESGYREVDTLNPLSQYAISKRWAEVFVEQLLNKFYIIRTSWLFGESRPTFIDKMVEWARDGKDVPCLTDMRSAPTYTPDLAKALLQLTTSGLFGTYHLTNSDFCTRVELASYVLKLHRLPENVIKPMTQKQFNAPAPRPTFSGLDNFTWRLNGFKPLRSWKDAVKEHFSMGARVQ
jgi:dTDP-4-dehydrorhamnose reductase